MKRCNHNWYVTGTALYPPVIEVVCVRCKLLGMIDNDKAPSGLWNDAFHAPSRAFKLRAGVAVEERGQYETGRILR